MKNNVEISWQGGACPYQAEGFINKEPFYFRYRHGHYSLDINNQIVLRGDKGGPYDGTMSNDEFESILTEYLNSVDKENNGLSSN